MSPSSSEKNPKTADPVSPEETQEIFGQAVITGLIALLLVASTYCYFVMKLNKRMRAHLEEIAPQVQDLQKLDSQLSNLLNDMSGFSQQHPEMRQLLAKYGIQTQQPAPQEPGQLPPLPPPPK